MAGVQSLALADLAYVATLSAALALPLPVWLREDPYSLHKLLPGSFNREDRRGELAEKGNSRLAPDQPVVLGSRVREEGAECCVDLPQPSKISETSATRNKDKSAEEKFGREREDSCRFSFPLVGWQRSRMLRRGWFEAVHFGWSRESGRGKVWCGKEAKRFGMYKRAWVWGRLFFR